MYDAPTVLRELRDEYAGSMWPDPLQSSRLWQADFIAICNVHIRRAEANRRTWWQRVIPEGARHWFIRNT